ncbi:MAG: M28 family peptidase [Bacteroidota bacterium]|nr:M28 family peptidase [Bacteroidota bacterium]
MKKIYLFFLFITFQFASFAQDLVYAKQIIEKLSSSEFMGRGYVDNGDKITADYLAKEFQRLDLIPLNKGSFFQKFSIPVNTFPNRVHVKIDNTELQPAVDYLVDATSPSVDGIYSVYKITRQDIDTDEKLVKLIRNAGNSFILIDNSDKKSESNDRSNRIDNYINFLKSSPEIPAKGIIFYSKDKLTWDGAINQAPRPVIIINKPIDLNTVNTIEVTVDATLIDHYETQNIIGFIKGTSTTDSTIVVTAHYDHLGKMGKEVYFPGANDNASGVAMLLNLAKHYSEVKPKYSMVFIALSAEELGILGAKAYTDAPLTDLRKIKFLINFDLAGTGDEGIKIVNGSVFKEKFDLLSKINQANSLLPKVNIRGAACNSDHCAFYKKGVPCFYIYTQGGIQAYHDIYDKSETLPLTKFVNYCTLMIKFFDSL